MDELNQLNLKISWRYGLLSAFKFMPSGLLTKVCNEIYLILSAEIPCWAKSDHLAHFFFLLKTDLATTTVFCNIIRQEVKLLV